MISNILRANISAPARRLILIAVAPLLIWGAHPARAQECGDVIGPGGHVSLSNDITSCPEPGPAVKIVGPVSVNLKGYTISCGAAITGVEVQGENARIQNGVVEDCEDGIDVGGDGKHVLLKLTVTSTQNEVGDRGFRVRSDRNHLIDDYADHFNGEGFRIDGDDNRVTNSRATGTTNEGFRINGNDNQIKNNWATENFNHAFRIGGNSNELVNNHAEGNEGGEGFRLDGSGNRLVNNVAVNNGDEGFRIRDGQDNTLINNRAEGNGTTENEPGIRIQEDGNMLRSNAFHDNFGDGILVVEGAENNTITHNVATGNDGIDLVDENLGCDNNQWSGNRFSTRSQDCID